ncbi:unnamed protein product [Penicillium palitans]
MHVVSLTTVVERFCCTVSEAIWLRDFCEARNFTTSFHSVTQPSPMRFESHQARVVLGKTRFDREFRLSILIPAHQVHGGPEDGTVSQGSPSQGRPWTDF